MLNHDIHDDSTMSFTITDTGEGISPDDQLIIFERFRQAENANKKLLSGTGLGLSITQSLVKLLGGEIAVDSELDKGSTFTFSISIKA